MPFGQDLFLVMCGWRVMRQKKKMKKKNTFGKLSFISILFLLICYPDRYLKEECGPTEA